MMFRPMNGSRSCNNPCKNGGTCEYNAATKTTTCKCVADFYGPTCDGMPTLWPVTTAVIVGVLLLVVGLLIAGAIAGGVIIRRRKQTQEEETARRNSELAEQGGLFSLTPLEYLGQILQIWE